MPKIGPCNPTARETAARGRRLALALAAILAVLPIGCAQQRYITLRQRPNNVLATSLGLLNWGGPKPTPRTEQLLRRYDLVTRLEKEPEVVLASLQEKITAEPTPEEICSFAEISYIEGKRLDTVGKPREALDRYGAAVAHAYWYLLDPKLDRFRNPYDPQFRRACDLYNESLEAAMRIANKGNKLRPGEMQIIQTGNQQYQVETVLRGPWHAEDIERLEFVSDYELGDLLTNRHHTYGLGVPLIAVRKKHEGETPAERYYPPGLSFPVTAFLRVDHQTPHSPSGIHRCVLELYDPMYRSNIEVCNRLVPLETDLTTPLAYFLDSKIFKKQDISWDGLWRPAETQGIKGLYMVEPFDPNRIPVVMVHGLWSTPTTWMEMFNDLRAFPEIRNRYQFWFFLYPTGQPFWTSAAQLRETLADVRKTLDPQQQNPRLDQLVLVGHSMGGLVSKMQTIESRDDFWRIISDKPLEELEAKPEEKSRLAKAFYFEPNPSVKRVITIGTPHQGSIFANEYTRYVGRKFIVLPEKMVELTNKVVRDNPRALKNTDLLTTTNSIDSLAPDCPIFPVLMSAPKANWTQHHNIVGVIPSQTFVGRVSEKGDGVVGFDSAHLEDVVSELVIEADHLSVHQHPLSVLEVRRILLDHAAATETWVTLPPSGRYLSPRLTARDYVENR